MEKKSEPVVIETSQKMLTTLSLLREKVCTATAMSLDEVKGKTIIIKGDIVTIQ